MRYCTGCKKYALGEVCVVCGRPTVNPEPPRFSPQDKYGRYRRMLKKGEKHGKS